jgi:lysozyme
MKSRIIAVVGASLISVAGLFHIQSSEGVRYTAYPDPATGAAPWTICWGHTGPEVHKGLTVTHKQCELWLNVDIREHEGYVRKLVKVPVKQGEYDALVSFSYNVGPANLGSSTLLRKLNAGDRIGSCMEYSKWIYADKRILNGLRTRRYNEQAMCLKEGDYVYDPRTR